MESLEAIKLKFLKSMPFLLSIQGFFCILQILNSIQPKYYPLVHRRTITETFNLEINFVFPMLLILLLWFGWAISGKHLRVLPLPAFALLAFPFLDTENIVTLASGLSVIGWIVIDRKLEDFIQWILVILIGLNCVSLLHWVARILDIKSPFIIIAQLETGLNYLIGYSVPVFALLFMSTWILEPILINSLGVKLNSNISTKTKGDLTQKKGSNLLLIFTLGLGIFSAFLPYFPTVNPNGITVGVDAKKYIQAGNITQSDISQSLIVMNGSRPFFFIIMYIIQKIFMIKTTTLVMFLPTLLIPLLGLAAAYLSWEIFENRYLSSWTAFFTICSYQTTVGMYSYFLSNMMSLIIAFFSLGFFFKSLKNNKNTALLIAICLNVLLIFTHPWTFIQYFSSFLLYFLVNIYYSRSGLKNIKKIIVQKKYYLTYMMSFFIATILKFFIQYNVSDMLTYQTIRNHVINLPEFWMEMVMNFRLLYGGLESIYIIFILSTLGALFIKRNQINNFLQAILVISYLPFIIGIDSIKGRLIYNIPIGIFAAMGIFILKKNIQNNKTYTFCLTFVTINLINNLIRSLINII